VNRDEKICWVIENQGH